MQLTIFDRWRLEFPEGSEEGWFLEYVLRSPKGASNHLNAGRLCYEALADTGIEINSAFEVFGGIGGNSLIVEDLWSPLVHIVNEYDLQAVDALVNNLGDDMTVSYADAYRSDFDPTADLVTLDFGDLTAWKTREGQSHRALLDKTFSAGPKAVLVTDIASRYLHLHRSRYESLLGEGTCDTYPHYIEALASRIQKLYDYNLWVGYIDNWSTVMAFTQGYLEDRPSLQENPGYPNAIKIG
jgi:hypothetical protein